MMTLNTTPSDMDIHNLVRFLDTLKEAEVLPPCNGAAPSPCPT